MHTIFYFFNCFLLVRLFTQWSDDNNSSFKNNLLQAMGVFLLILPLVRSWGFVFLTLVIILCYQSFVLFTERRAKNLFWGRSLQLLFLILFSSCLYGMSGQNLQFSDSFTLLLSRCLSLNILTAPLELSTFFSLQLYLFGILITVQELNNIIRGVLRTIQAAPVKGDEVPQVDSEELKRGKIIGAIERILFFFFVMTGNYASIGFILAAKGFTRFRDLDDKNFAEYVLIGTLLSSSLSIFAAEFVKRVLL